MAEDFDVSKKLMTVQQVMEAINARAPSTVTRAIKQKKLRATRVGAMGWLVYRDSVEKMIAAERSEPRAGGFPRGSKRKTAAAKKPAKATKKSARR